MIWTDKTEYLPGESVTVTIENNLTSEIIMYCDLPWQIVSVPDEEQIAPCSCATWIISLGPSESRSDTLPNPPAISVLFVAALAHPEFLLEVEAVAVVPEE